MLNTSRKWVDVAEGGTPDYERRWTARMDKAVTSFVTDGLGDHAGMVKLGGCVKAVRT
jgi:hypothetical protein